MSRQKKLRKRLLARPKDFTWDELKVLLDGYGYTLVSGNGSRRKFKNIDNDIINLHEPHPDKIIKQYILKEIIEKLGLGN